MNLKVKKNICQNPDFPLGGVIEITETQVKKQINAIQSIHLSITNQHIINESTNLRTDQESENEVKKIS